jgi:predicted ester cyclase
MGHVEENKSVIRRFVEEVQNNKNWDVFDELNAEDFVNHSAPPGVPNDREGGKLYLAGFMGAFPDSRFTIDDMIAEGDQVVTKKTFTGIMRVRDGKIVEHWLAMDQLSFMQQLGVLPT